MSSKTNLKKDSARKKKIQQQKHREHLKKKKMKPGAFKLSAPAVVTQEMYPDELHRFWIASGVNYLVSDYDNGVWDPMFPAIYEGGEVTSAEIASKITNKYAPLADKDRHWPKEGRTAMSWSLINREIAYVYYREAIRRLTEHNKKKVLTMPEGLPEDVVKTAANPIVWEVFKYMLDSVK